MKRIFLSLFALASLTGACDDPAAEPLAVSEADSAEVEFRGLCDEHPISSIFWEGIQPWGDPAEMEYYWCEFITECNEISNGKPECVVQGLILNCSCGGAYGCFAMRNTNEYFCGF